MRLAIALARDERREVALGDAHRGAKAMRDKVAALDPAAHRAHRHGEERRHRGDGEERVGQHQRPNDEASWRPPSLSKADDELLNRLDWDQAPAPDLQCLELAGVDQIVKGGAADPQFIDRLLDRQQAWQGFRGVGLRMLQTCACADLVRRPA